MRSTNILAMTNPLVLLAPRRERRQPGGPGRTREYEGASLDQRARGRGHGARFAHLCGGYD